MTTIAPKGTRTVEKEGQHPDTSLGETHSEDGHSAKKRKEENRKEEKGAQGGTDVQ